jgi:hypothetical protein
MPILRLEHPITDFAVWKAAFDRDPIDRAGSGVRGYRIYRPVGDPKAIAVDLEFDTTVEADRFRVALDGLWRSAEAAPALAGKPRVRIVESVERREYDETR